MAKYIERLKEKVKIKKLFINSSNTKLLLLSKNLSSLSCKFVYCKKKKMKKNSKKEYLNRDEVNEMIESAIRRHNRRSTIISSVLGWILIGGYSFGLFQAVQNV